MATPRPNTLRRLLLSSSWKTLNWFLSSDWFSSIFHLTFFFLPFPSYTSPVNGIHPASSTLTDARHHNKTQIFPFANWRVSLSLSSASHYSTLHHRCHFNIALLLLGYRLTIEITRQPSIVPHSIALSRFRRASLLQMNGYYVHPNDD